MHSFIFRVPLCRSSIIYNNLKYLAQATKPLFLASTFVIFLFPSVKVILTQKNYCLKKKNGPMTQMEAWDIICLGYLSFGSFEIPQLRYEEGRGWHQPPPHCVLKWILRRHFKPPPNATV
jgi:hypothetical protein